jgi:release factor glutamine methyltransferase
MTDNRMHESIYIPAEDTAFLQEFLTDILPAHILQGCALEIGCGNAQITQTLAKSFDVDAVDINPYALEHTARVVTSARVFASDCYSAVGEQCYDVIVSNPPYLPRGPYDGDDLLSHALVGGVKGYEVALRIIQDAHTHLRPGGFVVLLYSSLTNPDVVIPAFERSFLRVIQTVKRYVGLHETLFITLAQLDSGYSLAQSMGCTQLRYFSHGKRGMIYTGQYQGKSVAVKVGYDPVTSDKEARNLSKVRALGIGPQVLAHAPGVVIYEFVEGLTLRDYLASQPLPEAVEAVFTEIRRQCAVLDSYGIRKYEMTNPYKHVIINPSTLHVTLLDFERSKWMESANNVGQFAEFCKRHYRTVGGERR